MNPPASRNDKVLVILAGKIRTPPLSMEARREAGWLLRRLQQGERLSMPESRPMPTVGLGCHELRIDDLETKKEWRVIYYLAADAIVVLDVFAKTTPRTPTVVIARAKARLAKFEKDELP
jgi:phage-related protein